MYEILIGDAFRYWSDFPGDAEAVAAAMQLSGGFPVPVPVEVTRLELNGELRTVYQDTEAAA
jgi:hypothetical protein